MYDKFYKHMVPRSCLAWEQIINNKNPADNLESEKRPEVSKKPLVAMFLFFFSFTFSTNMLWDNYWTTLKCIQEAGLMHANNIFFIEK